MISPNTDLSKILLSRDIYNRYLKIHAFLRNDQSPKVKSDLIEKLDLPQDKRNFFASIGRVVERSNFKKDDALAPFISEVEEKWWDQFTGTDLFFTYNNIQPVFYWKDVATDDMLFAALDTSIRNIITLEKIPHSGHQSLGTSGILIFEDMQYQAARYAEPGVKRSYIACGTLFQITHSLRKNMVIDLEIDEFSILKFFDFCPRSLSLLCHFKEESI